MGADYPGKPGPDGPSKYTDEFIKGLAEKLRAYTADEEITFPQWAEFCLKNRIHRGIRKELCDKSPEFSDAFEEMMAKQHVFLNKAGISKRSNAGFVKFLMINNHTRDDGQPYKDKTEHELAGPGGQPLPAAAPVIIFADKEDQQPSQ